MRRSFVRKALAYALPLTILTSGCNKQNDIIAPPPPTEVVQISPSAITADRGLLHFAKMEDYKAIVDMPTDEAKSLNVSLIKQLHGFQSAADKQASGARDEDVVLIEMIESEYFKEMLNENLAVWIEDHIYRVNPEDGKVFVIEASKILEKYDDLIAENVADPDVKSYPSELDVLEIIRNGGDPQAISIGCSAPSCGSQFSQGPLSDNSAKWGKAYFSKYGIYFSLFARIENQASWPSPYEFVFEGGINASAGYVFYKNRCGNLEASYHTVSSGSWTLSSQKYQSYEGWRNLEKVYFRFKVRQKEYPYAILTSWIGFWQNL